MSELPDDVLELQQLAFRYFLDHTNASGSPKISSASVVFAGN
jgi:hypothetical protein